MNRLFAVGLFLLQLGALDAQTTDPLALASVLPASGAFGAPLVVDVKVPSGTAVRYRFLETPSTANFPWTGPLTLEALPGEARTYTLRVSFDLPSGESVTRDCQYVVSRAADPQPHILPVPGSYSEAVTVQPDLPPGWTLKVEGQIWTGTQVLDAPLGGRKTWVLEASGPSNRSVTWTYLVDRRDQEVTSLEILSPRPGSWANNQALVLAFQGVDRVRWSYGPTLDGASALDYLGPVALTAGGNQQITVGFRSRRDGQWRYQTVAWTNGTAQGPVDGWPASGASLVALDLPPVASGMVSWDEGHSWEPSVAVHHEAPSTEGRKVLSVLVRSSVGLFRSVYWLDARPPLVPQLSFSGGWNPAVSFSGTTEAFYQIVWTFADGKTSEDRMGLWGPLGAWKVPDGVVAARVTARTLGGLTSAPSALAFSPTGWSVPEWEPWDLGGAQTDRSRLPLGGRLLPRPGFRPVYEVSDKPEVPEPRKGSAGLDGAFLPSVPTGADRTFYVRFAWEDSAGLVGPATDAIAVRVDRVPPGVPEVVQIPGFVLVMPAEGEEEGTELSWAVTPDRVPSSEPLAFQPYQTALDSELLKSSAGGKVWFHAQARDRAGNLGPARLNVALADTGAAADEVVQVDPDPTVGETPIKDQGVYPWPQFRLRAIDQGRAFWVGVTDQSDIPGDWGARLQPWTSVVSRSVGRGERRTFVVYWNEKTSDGWSWDHPHRLTLTLDQGPPASPVYQGRWPSAPMSVAWSLALLPGRPGDSLRYSFTLDGTVPSDPMKAGQPWPGVQSWDAPPNGRVSVRVRVAAVSVSGLSVEWALTDPVVIDRTIPPVPVANLEAFTWSSVPVVVPLPVVAGTVRYTLTSDGSEPSVPTSGSPAVDSKGLPLAGAAGQTVLYRFRWRAYSPAGLAGSPSDAYSLLIDRTVSPVPVVGAGGSALPGTPPRILGFPAAGVASQAVVLKSDPADGFRYELSEGLASPRPVSPVSPLWPGTLTLDGGPGVDRQFRLSVRQFGADGTPGSAEVTYAVRVDRAVPGPADIRLAADDRRPEANLTVGPANPDESLAYRWIWDAYPEGHGEGPWQTLSDGPPVFVAPEGNLTHLTVQAFLKDEAGNEGPIVERRLLVDQNVVYVDPAGSGDGSRDHPSKTLTEGLSKAHLQGRQVVFLAQGAFAVSAPCDFGGLRIYGGWDAHQWESTPQPGHSAVVATNPFQGPRLVESVDRGFSLDRVDLSTGTVVLEAVVDLQNTDVQVRDSIWAWTGAKVGWIQSGGSLGLYGVTASWTGKPKATFLSLRSVDLQARSLVISGSQNRDGVLVALKDSTSFVRDLRVISKRAEGYDGVLTVTGGSFTLDGARIMAGEGAERAAGVVVKDAAAGFWNTEIDLYGSKSNTGFQTQGGRLEVEKSNVSLLRGDEFNQALVLVGGEASFQSFAVKVVGGAYQGGLTLDSGTLTLRSGTVQISGGGKKAWGAQFLGTCHVTIDEVAWSLETKTPGSVWLLQNPWADGSSAADSTVKGW